MKSISKSGFTLIEMIIVVIIIGILAAFLIPRFGAAGAKANDAARKAHLRQIATALINYQADTRRLPQTAAWVSSMIDALTKGGLSTIPYDPDGIEQFSGIAGVRQLNPYATGDYAYTPIYKNGVKKGGFVLMAETQTPGGSNRVWCKGTNSGMILSGFRTPASTGDWIGETTNFKYIVYCDKILFSGDSNGDPYGTGCKRATPSDTSCRYTDPEQLRYILKY